MTCTTTRILAFALATACAFLIARDFARDHAEAYQTCERAHSRATCQHVLR